MHNLVQKVASSSVWLYFEPDGVTYKCSPQSNKGNIPKRSLRSTRAAFGTANESAALSPSVLDAPGVNAGRPLLLHGEGGEVKGLLCIFKY